MKTAIKETISARMRGKDIGFYRLRRITGYISTPDRFNNGKRAELKDRIKHKV